MKYEMLKDILKKCVLFMIPILGVVVLLFRYHLRIMDISIYNTPWNDELSYYKQIEGVITGGIPKGYFGYNESRAIIGTFGPWSPILMIPYCLIFCLIGIGTWQIILANVLLCALTMLGCGCLIKLKWRDVISLMLLWVFDSNINRYVFSVTPELLISLYVIWMLVCLYEYIDNSNDHFFYCYILFLAILTLSRGYYAIFGLLGVTFCYEKWKKFFSIGISAITAGCYWAIIHFFCSPYFTSLVNDKLVKAIFSPINFAHYIMYLIVDGFKTSYGYIKEIPYHTDNSFVGTYYLLSFAIITVAVLIGQIYRNKLLSAIAICYSAQVISIWLLYDIRAGSRHLMGSFIATAIITIITISRNYTSDVDRVLGILFICAITMITYVGETDYDIKPPIVDLELEKAIREADIQINLRRNCWDNTVIWTLGCNFSYLYGIPAGMGLNICQNNYLLENATKIKARYIAIDEYDEIMKALANQMEWESVSTLGDINIYATK